MEKITIKLTKAHYSLIDYLKSRCGEDDDITGEFVAGLCLVCRTENQAQDMLEYCKECETLDTSDLLEKAVEKGRE